MKQASFSTAMPRPAAGAEMPGWSIKNLLARGARDWRLSTGMTAFISAGAPALVMLIGAATALMGKAAYKWFTREDGIAEDLQVLLFVAALALCVPVVSRIWKTGAKVFALMYAMFGLGLFFIIGEELSWGQRIFGWETSTEMKAINKQEETNIHNIEGVGDKIKWVHVLIGAYGTFLPLFFLRAQLRSRPHDAASLLVPHYTLLPYFVTTLLWRLQSNLWKPPKSLYFVITEYSEVMELVLALAFFMVLFYQFRNLGGAEKPAVAASGALVEEPVLNSRDRVYRSRNQRVR
ncbi:MAG: hypothetical protein ALAOOOJD_00807 [bacterium]|nr:hypothetical protein [bacterium]